MARRFLLIILIGLSGCSLVHPRTAQQEKIYIAAKGDTLEQIAKRCSVDVEELLAYNGIKNPKALRVGQVVKIPSVGPLVQDVSLHLEDHGKGIRRVGISHVKRYVGRLAFPVRGARHTSTFGWRGARFHEGADFAAPEGTPVYAAHDGQVVLSSNSYGKYGRIVAIQGEGLLTVYGHNSKNRVAVGDRVSKGDHISDVGESGRASGPHLHFETRVLDDKGRYSAVDPFVFFVRMQE